MTVADFEVWAKDPSLMFVFGQRKHSVEQRVAVLPGSKTAISNLRSYLQLRQCILQQGMSSGNPKIKRAMEVTSGDSKKGYEALAMANHKNNEFYVETAEFRNRTER
jgi:hypothetical protein